MVDFVSSYKFDPVEVFFIVLYEAVAWFRTPFKLPVHMRPVDGWQNNDVGVVCGVCHEVVEK